MKSLTVKTLMPLAVISIAALLLTAAMFVGERAVALRESAQDDLLIVALTLGGAAASMVKGFVRESHHNDAKHPAESVSSEAQHDDVISTDASMFNLGA